ncbi:putative epoxide hydrolase [Colletotrichum spaethianum]|uniref:Epoxide hydrolase n=1 Tax=Colletotrichum spaethianum TaxID=700344 RepID=A0AA37P8F4_9PEZI|nr:putative epoxide hydrolase [Colletotrichum spaethianum]GKT47559.1 putative epoxide hydrolase [Colletotrichum spaethianum]
MGPDIIPRLAVGLMYLDAVTAAPSDAPFNLRPFKIDLAKGVPRMLDLVRDTRLPEKPQYPGVGSNWGIDLDVLKSLQKQWLEKFDWKKEEKSMNSVFSFKHFTADIEGLNIHFIHEKSKNPDAIPLILNHGWPGSFLEFAPIIKKLTETAKTSTGKSVSFNVVVPSLPGFAFSSSPPGNWTLDDTARVYNTLMTKVLGYKTFAAHGTSHGAPLTFTLYDVFNTTTRAAHFVFIPFLPTPAEQITAMNITLSPLEQFELDRSTAWGITGNAYFLEHTTKPNTIGLALYDNPVGQLAWIGEKYISWSDPNAGKSPSILNHNEILRCISLYYLTHSFVSSVYTYAQDPGAFERVYRKASTDAPMLVSYFKYMVPQITSSEATLLGLTIQLPCLGI